MDEREKIKVLIVDDEDTIHDFFKRLLSFWGIKSVSVKSGYEAIELVKKEEFDLYFIDICMPQINGLDTFRQIRRIHPQAMVVMMTGYAGDEILDTANKDGILGHIFKPFNINEIKETVTKISREKINSSFKVLVIDDDEAVLVFFSEFLKRENCKYRVARDKNETLAAIREEKFDLIFLDLVLKDISGTELYRDIKAILPEVDIILISGYPHEVTKIKNKIQLFGYLDKPLVIEEIIGYIKKAKARK